MRRFRLGPTTAILVAGLSGIADGQRLTGEVREAVSRDAISGAVVSAVDSAGVAVGRTLTGADGRYVLVAPPRSATVRIVRIGFVAVSRPLPIGGSLDIAMDRVPALLDAVRISSNPTCEGSGNARAALQLWEQARAALLAAIVAREANPAQATTMKYQRRFNLPSRRVTEHRVDVNRGITTRPVISGRPAAELARHGYMQLRGGERFYFGPDADVMFDDTFTAEHCFGVRTGSGEHRGRLGLSFIPRSSGGRDSLVDVRGTLWLDSTASSLVGLEFEYTGVSSAAERAGMGGTLRFQTMPNGVVFISEWTISLPIAVTLGRGGAVTINEMTETGGVVLSGDWRDGSKWVGPIGAIRGRVTEKGSDRAARGVGISLKGVATTVTDSVGRFLFGLLPPGRYGLEVHDTAFAEFVRPRGDDSETGVNRGDTTEINFQVESRTTLMGTLCKDRRGTLDGVVLGRVSDGSGSWPRDLKVEAEWLAGVTQTGVGISAAGAHAEATVDAGGRFFICGIPRGGPTARLRLMLGSLTVADTALRDNGSTPRVITWAVRPALFASAGLRDASVFSGRVVRATDASPVPDAEVSLTGAGMIVRTDSMGLFRFVGLKAGQHIVEVRRLGARPRRDTVSLSAGAETAREISIAEAATPLDTVRATSQVRYRTKPLRDFEDRRARGLGRFIAEAELRQHDNQSLPAILQTRITGIRFLTYRSMMLAASTRGGTFGASTQTLADPKDRSSPRGCWIDVFLDGLAIYTGPPQIAPDVSRMRVMEFGGIEYYPDAASLPSQFRSISSTGCGVLLLWTRER